MPCVTIEWNVTKLTAVKGPVDRHRAVACGHQVTVDGRRQTRSLSHVTDQLVGFPVDRRHSPDTVRLPVWDEEIGRLRECHHVPRVLQQNQSLGINCRAETIRNKPVRQSSGEVYRYINPKNDPLNLSCSLKYFLFLWRECILELRSRVLLKSS